MLFIIINVKLFSELMHRKCSFKRKIDIKKKSGGGGGFINYNL